MLFLLSVLAIVFAKSNAHGIMCAPRQRGAYHSIKCGSNIPELKNAVIDHCAHCLNGGTVATTKINLPTGGWKNYEPTKNFADTAGRAGLCGDAKGDNAHMLGGLFMKYPNVPIVSNYQTGGTVDFAVEIDTNHNGYFDFFLCNLDDCGTTDLSEKCFSGDHCYQLQRVKHKDCEDTNVNTNFDCGPVDAAYPGRWYVPCRKTDHDSLHIVGGSSGTMRYKLPAGVECNHCVIQWYWGTANSCAPAGFLDYFTNYNNPFGTTCPSDGGGLGGHRPGMTQCSGDLVPEEFWSCADVQITKDGKTAGPIESTGSPEISDSTYTSPDPKPVEVIEPIKGDEEVSNNEESRSCIHANARCDGSIPCCDMDDMEQVCVHRKSSLGFSCRLLWSLWDELEASEESDTCPQTDEACDGSVSCCDKEQVCAYSVKTKASSCQFLWSLWD